MNRRSDRGSNVPAVCSRHNHALAESQRSKCQFIEAIVALASELGIPTVGEGIERDDPLNAHKALGDKAFCWVGQPLSKELSAY
jgi:EAL domain-containing protein (putative c-di-GMP-specific phosphodiesterase class I)